MFWKTEGGGREVASSSVPACRPEMQPCLITTLFPIAGPTHTVTSVRQPFWDTEDRVTVLVREIRV